MRGTITIKTQKDCNFVINMIKEYYNIDITLTVKRIDKNRQTILAKIDNSIIDFGQSYLIFEFMTDRTYKNEYFELMRDKTESDFLIKTQRICFYERKLITYL